MDIKAKGPSKGTYTNNRLFVAHAEVIVFSVVLLIALPSFTPTAQQVLAKTEMDGSTYNAMIQVQQETLL
jgi:hypothetical protein